MGEETIMRFFIVGAVALTLAGAAGRAAAAEDATGVLSA